MILECRGLLFDLDGTLIDSLHAVERAWTTWALSRGFEPGDVLPRVHGRKSIDSIRDLLPEVDAAAEDLVIRQIETSDTRGVAALPGAASFLAALPVDCWGLVTSGTRDVAFARLRAAGLPLPGRAVCGDDVEFGKPHPEPFLTGAALLGLDPADVVAFEDAAPGIASARAAGMRVVCVGGLVEPSVADFRAVRAQAIGGGLRLAIGPLQ